MSVSRQSTSLRRAVLVCAVVASCESLTEVVARDRYSATLSGSAVRPDSVATNGSGTFHLTLTSDTSLMTYELTFGGLTTAATAAHLHGPAADTVAADVLMDFAALPAGASGMLQLGTSGSASGSIDLARPVKGGVSGDSLRKLLIKGLVYVDVHTGTQSPEIRGQIRR